MVGRSRSLTLPPPELEHDALREFIRTSQPWSAERAPVPAGLRRVLWVLIPIDLVWGFWLATIVLLNPCLSPVCEVATLHPYTPVLVGAAALSLGCLVVVAVTTRGLAQVDGREVAAITVAVVTGGITLVGIAALILVALIAALLLAAFWAAFTFQP